MPSANIQEILLVAICKGFTFVLLIVTFFRLTSESVLCYLSRSLPGLLTYTFVLSWFLLYFDFSASK